MSGNPRERVEIQPARKWKGRETSPERTKVWTEPRQKLEDRRIPVVYYLSRNGVLEHPHFMEVALSSAHGLYLRDVITRLNLLRGNCMTSMYSWSCKRSYKNGYVWQDLGENDFIYPAHGQEYILKGSELLLNSKPDKSDEEGELVRRRDESWSSGEFSEYNRVYKTESSGEICCKAADASTQTDERVRKEDQNQSTVLNCEISPPRSDSSPETLESLMKTNGIGNSSIRNPTARNSHSGRMKTSAVLMQLISCGSMSFCDSGAPAVKDDRQDPNVSSFRVSPCASKDSDESPHAGGRIAVEQKEFFSGSFAETKKDEVPSLKRSSSFNADRSSGMGMEKDATGVRTKCMQRKQKAGVTQNG